MDWNTRGVEAGSDVMALTHPQMHTESTNKNFEKKTFFVKKKIIYLHRFKPKIKENKKKTFCFIRSSALCLSVNE